MNKFTATINRNPSLRALLRNKTAIFGIIVALVLIFLALFGPLIVPYPEDQGKVAHLEDALQPPSIKHLFGTDNLGRDVFSRTIIGTRISLSVSLIVVCSSLLIGIILGLIAGYFGGWIEIVIMRITDVFVSIPRLLLPIVFSGILGPSLQNSMIALIVTWWPWYVRLLVGEIKVTKEKEFIEAAKGVGVGTFRMMFRHILPNSISSIVVQGSLDIGWAIMMCGTLGFIGLGAQPPSPEWGALVSGGRIYMPDFWWWSTFPGLFIFISVLGFNMIGDGLRDFLDPRTRTQVG